MAENNIENIVNDNHLEEENSFDFRNIIVIFILNWQWFLVSIIILKLQL